jgi:hypothetical protein
MRKIIVEKNYSINIIDKDQMLMMCPLFSQNLTFEVGLDDGGDIVLRHRETYLLDDLIMAYNLVSRHRDGIIAGIKSFETR